MSELLKTSPMTALLIILVSALLILLVVSCLPPAIAALQRRGQKCDTKHETKRLRADPGTLDRLERVLRDSSATHPLVTAGDEPRVAEKVRIDTATAFEDEEDRRLRRRGKMRAKQLAQASGG